MPLLLFSELNINDTDKYEAYMEKVGPLFLEHGIALHANDYDPVPMSGQDKPDKVVLIEFKNAQHMQNFLALPEYIAASQDRDAGVKERTMIFKSWNETK